MDIRAPNHLLYYGKGIPWKSKPLLDESIGGGKVSYEAERGPGGL